MLLPYASDRPPRDPPLAVVLLVLLHFSVFGLIALALSSRPQAAITVYANLSLVPNSLRWYAPFTYLLLHVDVFHLAANMLFLWVFGGSVEDSLKWKRFLLLYIGAGVLTGLLQVGMAFVLPGADRGQPIVGASGAVSAIVGIFAVRFYRSRIRFIGLPWRVPALALVAVVLASEMAATIWHLVQTRPGESSPMTAHWAHIGGFVLGLAWAQMTRLFDEGRHEYMADDAQRALKQGSPLSAVRRWEAVLAAQPGNLDARAELARAWAAAGDRDQSVPHFLTAIEGLLAAGRKRDAAACYRDMNAAFPGEKLSTVSLYAVAAALEEMGEYSVAADAFRSVVRNDENTPEAEMAGLRLGVLQLNRLGDPTAAAASLEAFLKRHPATQWRSYAEDLLRTARVKAKGNAK